MLTLITVMIKCLQINFLYLWFITIMSSQCFVFNFFLLFLFSFIGFGCFHCCLVVVFGWDFFFSKTDILDTSIFRKILLMINTFLYFYFFFSFLQFSSNKDLYFWYIYPEGDFQMHMGNFTGFFLTMLFPTTADTGITSWYNFFIFLKLLT